MGASSVQRLRAVTGGACGPCSCSPHPPWPSTMRRSGRYCSVGAGGVMPCRDGARWATPCSASTRAGRSATCPPGREQAQALGHGRHVGCPLRRCSRSGGVAAWRPPAWRLARSSPGGPSSLFQDRRREAAQTTLVRQRVGERPMTGNLILVTHQVNITALTGIAPAAGEMVILTPQGDNVVWLGVCPHCVCSAVKHPGEMVTMVARRNGCRHVWHACSGVWQSS